MLDTFSGTVVIDGDEHSIKVTRRTAIPTDPTEMWEVEGTDGAGEPFKLQEVFGDVVGDFQGVYVDYTNINDLRLLPASKVLEAAQNFWYEKQMSFNSDPISRAYGISI